jgi:hypothetical protein
MGSPSMSNNLNAELLAQMFGQVSDDPFLMFVTLSHPDITPVYLVNNTVDQISRGQVYTAFPMQITLPTDDGESNREVKIDFDNVSRELIDEMRSITTPMDVKIEMALASNPDLVQLSLEELKLRSVTYDKQRISARLQMDNFLNVELNAEKYTPDRYPGLF